MYAVCEKRGKLCYYCCVYVFIDLFPMPLPPGHTLNTLAMWASFHMAASQGTPNDREKFFNIVTWMSCIWWRLLSHYIVNVENKNRLTSSFRMQYNIEYAYELFGTWNMTHLEPLLSHQSLSAMSFVPICIFHQFSSRNPRQRRFGAVPVHGRQFLYDSVGSWFAQSNFPGCQQNPDDKINKTIALAAPKCASNFSVRLHLCGLCVCILFDIFLHFLSVWCWSWYLAGYISNDSLLFVVDFTRTLLGAPSESLEFRQGHTSAGHCIRYAREDNTNHAIRRMTKKMAMNMTKCMNLIHNFNFSSFIFLPLASPS